MTTKTIIDGLEYALLPLSQGKSAIVDLDMVEELSRWKWSCNGSGYACKTFRRGPSGKWLVILMHHVVLRPKEGLQIDHINGNKVDNRRVNLRHATQTQNNRNRPIQRSNKLGFKGVFWRRERFEVSIRAGGKSIYIGRYMTPEVAQHAYNAAALKLHGEFAKPHQPHCGAVEHLVD